MENVTKSCFEHVAVKTTAVSNFSSNPWAQNVHYAKVTRHPTCFVDEGPRLGDKYIICLLVLEMEGLSRVVLATPSGMLCAFNWF